MGKSSKNKKNKVPKITEEEYAAYLSALKAPSQVPSPPSMRANALESNVRGVVGEVQKP